MRLLPIWTTFNATITEYAAKGQELHDQFNKARTVEALEQLSQGMKQWSEEVYQYLIASFYPQRNHFATDFFNARGGKYSNSNGQKEAPTLIKEKIEDLTIKIKTLNYNLKIIGASDALIRPEEIDLEARKQYNTNETVQFLLDKLYDLNDDDSYSIVDLLEGNGIQLSRRHEDREIAKALKDRGLIEDTAQGKMYVKLTIEGRFYVEERRKEQPTDYSRINQDQVNEKIDQIIIRLKELHFGQQIIFDELETLKDANGKLDKKSWGQLLKMKLFDLVVDKSIDKATGSQIFKELTDQALAMIS